MTTASTGPSIVGLGTARAPYLAEQRVLGEMYDSLLSGVLDDRRAGRRARLLFRASRIETRQFAIPDFVDPASALVYRDQRLPSIGERMMAFPEAAIELAEQACRRALESAGLEPSRISHLVIATCTGVGAPDCDIELASRLGLPSSVERTQVVWMSCTGGFPALRVGQRALREEPACYSLVVCVEICSLHVRADGDSGSLLAHSLFADGASAVVLGSGAGEEKALAWIGSHRSEMMIEGRELLSWSFGDHGFRAHIDGDLPAAIEGRVGDFVAKVLPGGRSEVASWCVHPGGAAILDAVERALELSPDSLSSSREVLRTRGNMSSATIFYVLEKELARLEPGQAGFLLGFGTGLTMEGLNFTRGARRA
jgi:predicted naringenin-chalcone synthase